MLAVELQSSNSNHLLNLSIISSEILGQIHPTLHGPRCHPLRRDSKRRDDVLPQTSPSQNFSPPHRKKTQHGSRTRCAIPQRVNHSAHVLRCHDVLHCGWWRIYSLDQCDALEQNKPQPTSELWVAVPRSTHQWLSLSVETSVCSVATTTSESMGDKIRLYGELEMKNRLFRASHAKYCQQIEELRKMLRRNRSS